MPDEKVYHDEQDDGVGPITDECGTQPAKHHVDSDAYGKEETGGDRIHAGQRGDCGRTTNCEQVQRTERSAKKMKTYEVEIRKRPGYRGMRKT